MNASPANVYQGVYVIINPYDMNMLSNTGNAGLAELDAAAAASCTASPPTSPFCGVPIGTSTVTQSVNGIFLKIPWCGFEFYRPRNAASCHYTVYPTGYETLAAVNQSDCSNTTNPNPPYAPAYQYHTCLNGPTGASGTKGILSQALQDIVLINMHRTAKGLPHLKLSVALQAGADTPLTYLMDPSVGTIDLAALETINGASKTVCVRLPVPWGMTIINGYEAAFTALINRIDAISSGKLNGDIQIVKPSLFSTITDEFDMDGRDMLVGNTPADALTTGPRGSRIYGQGNPISRPNSTTSTELYGAQAWVDTFNTQSTSITNCTTGLAGAPATPTLDLEAECAFGRVIGYTRAILDPASGSSSMPYTLTDINQNGSTLLPDINCGLDGTTTCIMDTPGEQWSIFYFYQYVLDLLGGSAGGTGLAATAAAADYTRNGGNAADAVIQRYQLGTAWTSLTSDANAPDYFTDPTSKLDSTKQVPCGLNNTKPAREPLLTLSPGIIVPQLLGMQVVIGWQTHTMLGGDCSVAYMTGTLQPFECDQVMNSGFASDRGQFVEVQGDAAFADIGSCAGPLQTATAAFLNNLWGVSTCTYP